MSESRTYDCIKLWLDDESLNISKIEKYNRLIILMEDAVETGALSGHLEEYVFEDGQSKIRTTYRNPEDILKAITALERLRQMYINRTNGRTILLRPSRQMRYNRGGNS